MDLRRVKKLNQAELTSGPVLYWMSRDQRLKNNWASLFCQELSQQKNANWAIVFCLETEFLNAGKRQYQFMLDGLKEVEQRAKKLNIPFYISNLSTEKTIPELVKQFNFAAVVTDFSPLKIKTEWLKQLLPKLDLPVFQVDAHNVIPVWEASDKLEFAAYTLRPKIHKKIDQFLTPFPEITEQKIEPIFNNYPTTNWAELNSWVNTLAGPKPVDLVAGTTQAKLTFSKFLAAGLSAYENRNDPNLKATSNLSAYLHFGQISAQEITLEVFQTNPGSFTTDRESPAGMFLEELVVRKELADNFCFYEKNYDNFDGFHAWAKTSLNQHRNDQREFVYSLEELEQAKTYDNLWNAAQKEMVTTGKMHGFMRMYWGKKILEWTNSPEEALQYAIFLNDKYQLDGRDPNGYTGIAWSIGGVHDRAWTERPIFGKIRYMNYAGCKRKFNIQQYMDRFLGTNQDSLI